MRRSSPAVRIECLAELVTALDDALRLIVIMRAGQSHKVPAELQGRIEAVRSEATRLIRRERSRLEGIRIQNGRDWSSPDGPGPGQTPDGMSPPPEKGSR